MQEEEKSSVYVSVVSLKPRAQAANPVAPGEFPGCVLWIHCKFYSILSRNSKMRKLFWFLAPWLGPMECTLNPEWIHSKLELPLLYSFPGGDRIQCFSMKVFAYVFCFSASLAWPTSVTSEEPALCLSFGPEISWNAVLLTWIPNMMHYGQIM